VKTGLITTVASDGSTHVPSDCIHGSPTRHINPTRQHVSDPENLTYRKTRGHGFILIPIPLIASHQGSQVPSLSLYLIYLVSYPDIGRLVNRIQGSEKTVISVPDLMTGSFKKKNYRVPMVFRISRAISLLYTASAYSGSI
jgi:hypothetical protein